jgi:tRNA threonylcarbamoyladenosine biosynthesis protein TsaE
LAAHARAQGDTRRDRAAREPGEAPLKEYRLRSPEDTSALGARIGRDASGGTVIAFRGGLGAGKTTFAKGIARGLGIGDEVTSPTYTIVSEYEGRLRFRHIDAYRLSGDEDFRSVGGEDLIGDPDTVCAIEWSERLGTSIPHGAAIVEIRVEKDGSRLIRIEGEALESILE